MKKSNRIKQFSLIALSALTMALTSVQLHAADGREHNTQHQNLSKRPYQQAPEAAVAAPQEKWEGATLIDNEKSVDKSLPTKHQQMRINMLGKQPYMEKAGE